MRNRNLSWADLNRRNTFTERLKESLRRQARTPANGLDWLIFLFCIVCAVGVTVFRLWR